MFNTVYDYKAFYDTPAGAMAGRILRAHICAIWPDRANLDIMGYGYGVPYMDLFTAHNSHFYACIPGAMGIITSVEDGTRYNNVCLVHEDKLPLVDQAVDRILLMHSLEHAVDPQALLAECWRVLKGNGRLLVIVPSRAGLWSRADWSPFGAGAPYSLAQLERSLRACHFCIELREEALFMPPLRKEFFVNRGLLFERVMRYVMPLLAGVHMVEVSKQLFAGVPPQGGSRAVVTNTPIFVPKPAGIPAS
jgi:SAM-dependent methyltransferase